MSLYHKHKMAEDIENDDQWLYGENDNVDGAGPTKETLETAEEAQDTEEPEQESYEEESTPQPAPINYPDLNKVYILIQLCFCSDVVGLV